MSEMKINVPLTTNGPVYANGPVYVMGMDIKAELESIRIELESLKNYRPEQIEQVVRDLIKREGIIKNEEKAKLEFALNTAIKITDWVQRIKFWYETLILIEDPFLNYFVLTLLKLRG